jgi:beta-galactosidase
MPAVSTQKKLIPPNQQIKYPIEDFSLISASAISAKWIQNISYSGPSSGSGVKMNLKNNNKISCDKNYVFTNLSDKLLGAEYIQLPNNDRQYSALDLIQFDAGNDINLYIAHDDRLTRPAWLKKFQDTNIDIKVNSAPMSVFVKHLKKGSNITLGGNTDGPTPLKNNQYIIFAAKQTKNRKR